MKQLVTYLLLLSAPAVLRAQVDIENESVKRNRRTVEVKFDIATTPKTLKNRYKLVLMPYLYHGSDTAWLPRSEVYGKIRYKRERQERALKGDRNWRLSSGRFMEGGGYAYSASLPYEKWMRTASLGVRSRMVGCACDCYDGDRLIAGDLPVYTPPVPFVADASPEASKFEVTNARKRWSFDREEIKVFFPVSVTDLYPDRYGNRATLDKIVEGIGKIGNMEKLRLNGVEITGFASPEGGVAFNAELGEGRARALREYISGRIPELRDEDFDLVNGIENWDGLRQMVAASDMKDKTEILRIIDEERGEARKEALKRLSGGKPYRYMLETFYPELRNACYVAVYYDELADRGADAINAANARIRKGEYAQALPELMKYSEDDRAWNSIGVCLMMLEREEEAIGWFEKALGSGDEEARRNLEQLK